jgi:hypothetical protein
MLGQRGEPRDDDGKVARAAEVDLGRSFRGVIWGDVLEGTWGKNCKTKPLDGDEMDGLEEVRRFDNDRTQICSIYQIPLLFVFTAVASNN